MRFKAFLPFLAACMLLLFPLSSVEWHPQPTMEETPAVNHTSQDNESGWLASAGGASYERIRGMVPLSNGSMIIGGMFEQTIDFHGDVIGYSSEDSTLGIDFFLAWLDENGTWTNTMAGTSSGLDGIDSMGRLSDGTILVAGTFCGMTKGDPCNLTLGALEPLNKSADEHDNGVFLAAMNPFGEWLWATAFSNPFQMSVIDLMVLSNDHIHLAVLHRDSLASGEDLAPGSLSEDSIAILVLDENGAPLDMHTVFSSENLDATGSLCLDGSARPTSPPPSLIGSRLATTRSPAQVVPTSPSASTILEDGCGPPGAGGPGDASVTDCAGRTDGGVAIIGDFLQNMTFETLEVAAAVWVDFYEAHIERQTARGCMPPALAATAPTTPLACS